MMRGISLAATALAALLVLGAGGTPGLDGELRATLEDAGVYALDPGAPEPEVLTRLGQALFFDPILSGNRDISCATCHHPEFGTSDGLSLSIGTGGHGLGPARSAPDARTRIPRNATDLFNRGLPEWESMFWDGRVLSVADRFLSTALDQLPEKLDSPLAVQSMFPVTSRDEMRGVVGDTDIDGEPNELAAFHDTEFSAMWALLTDRLLAVPEYVDLFGAAYPGVPEQELGFHHAANALAAFQIHEWTLLDSPWDRYVAGADDALSHDAKRGALLFYGEAGCSACHSGPLLTDQEHHNIAIPQLGPGKGVNAPLDLGRFYISAEERDRFAFRTPPLRNVTITGPWMHNGAYADLEQAVRHHLDVHAALEDYDVAQLEPELRSSYWGSPAVHAMILETLDPLVEKPRHLSDRDVGDLLAFLEALTDPRAAEGTSVPARVPSGLDVERGTS